MNTNQLRYFVTAAECRSFTKAADQFYITQTAITPADPRVRRQPRRPAL